MIRAVPLKTAAQYAGGLAIATFFVVLLSFVFSFLGTLFCAALAGLMLGALRTHKWQSILISLLFPLVIFTLLKGMKTELQERQILLVCERGGWELPRGAPRPRAFRDTGQK